MKGGDLASIHSSAENDKVLNAIGSTQGVWIGLYRSSTSWAWTDGTPYDCSNWNPGEPNNAGGRGENNVQISSTKKWNDVKKTDTALGYVCRIEKAYQTCIDNSCTDSPNLTTFQHIKLKSPTAGVYTFANPTSSSGAIVIKNEVEKIP